MVTIGWFLEELFLGGVAIGFVFLAISSNDIRSKNTNTRKDEIITRKVVAFEGKPTVDGRLILPGALTVEYRPVVVTIGPVTAYDPNQIIGKAIDFERNDETGAISFDVITEKELSEKLNGHMFCTNLVYHMDNDVMIIEEATIRQIYFSESPQGWSSLTIKEPGWVEDNGSY